MRGGGNGWWGTYRRRGSPSRTRMTGPNARARRLACGEAVMISSETYGVHGVYGIVWHGDEYTAENGSRWVSLLGEAQAVVMAWISCDAGESMV